MAKNEKSLSKNGIYYLIYQVLNIAFPLVTGIYVTRVLLPESIGRVAAAQNLAEYFVIFAFLGIPTYGLREIAKARNNPQEKDQLFTELYCINFISTIVFSTIYLGLIFAVSEYRKDLVLYLITGISVFFNIFNISFLYEGLEEFRFISLRNIIFKAISFGMLLLFVRTEDQYVTYAVITVLGAAGNHLINMIYSPRFAKFRFQNLNLRRHMKSILYLVVVNLAIEIYSLMDITMMNFLCDKDSITFYKYGHYVELMLLQVINTFTIVLIPRISLYFKDGKTEEFNSLISKTLKIIILLAVPMIIGIWFTADFLITRIYGDAYIRSAEILKKFSILLLISPIGYLLGSRVMLVTGHESKMVIPVGIGAVVNLIGNFILIPRYLETGAAIASIVSEIVVMVVYVSMGRKYFKLQGMPQTVLKILIAGAAMTGFLLLSRIIGVEGWLLLIIQVAGSVGIFFGLLLLTGEEIIRHYSRQMIRKVIPGK